MTKNFFVQVFFGSDFFLQILMSPKGPPFIFLNFANECMLVQKLPKDPLLHFSALCDLPETKKNFEKNSKNRIFFQFFAHAGTVEKNT